MRKIIQISTAIVNEDRCIIALCDDGKIFEMWNLDNWYEIPTIPQNEPKCRRKKQRVNEVAFERI
jgi:hypothetical protein